MKKRFFAILLALVLMMSLGTAALAADDPNLGLYTAVRAGDNDMEVAADLVYEGGFTLELKSGGKCLITIDGETSSGKWVVKNGELTLTEKGSSYNGTLADGILVLEDLNEDGLYIIFVKEGRTLYDFSEPVNLKYDSGWWAGDWYGWWHTTNCTDEYENMEDNWWNACLRLEGEGDQLKATLWDQDLPLDNAVAEFGVKLAKDKRGNESAETGRGYFMDMGLTGGELYVTRSHLEDDVLYIELSYAVGDGSYEVDAMFKPWGETWDDVNEEDIPYFYEDWYLPLIESGVKKAPDTINPENMPSGPAGSGASSDRNATATHTGEPTTGERNALKAAGDYLRYSDYSYSGLIEMLEYDGYTHEEAVYAADNCAADWKAEACESADAYLSCMAFSYQGLIEQLEFEGFSHEEAEYAVDKCGADWNEQAVAAAKEYLDYSSYSRSRLIEALEYDGFTHEQAVYGAEQNGY